MTDAVEAMRSFETIIGRWRTSGTVFDEHGERAAMIVGTDEYEWMPGGKWVVHRVDVMMGEDRVQALELIGDHDAVTGTYVMRAFDGSGAYGRMSADLNADGSWTFLGDGMRSTLWPSEDKSSMTARWEREDDTGSWVHWMDMRFVAMA
ncbi:hypothetical protein [Rhodococcus qingshengii]|uniref:hypothetical protein n=1 Tax=Rhodococcus qingshengii TaxID=334542 RepID=UPI001BEC75B8|nr:hypothetical protein [Rhodococcus qingshengii]MBT2274010.1 hypothetical protein [Rhodococcus qingshengii]